MSQASTTTQQQPSGHHEDRRSHAAPTEQRSALHGLLKALDFLHGEEALKPREGGPGGGGAGGGPKIERPMLSRMLCLVPQALGEVDEAEGEDKRPVPETSAPEGKVAKTEGESEGKEDPAAKERSEVEQSLVALTMTDAPGGDVESEGGAPQTPEVEGLDAMGPMPGEGEQVGVSAPDGAPEQTPAPVQMQAPVQMKGRPAPKPAPKPASKVAPKPAPKVAPGPKVKARGGATGPAKVGPGKSVGGKKAVARSGGQSAPQGAEAEAPTTDSTPLTGPQCRAAFKWTVKQAFAKEPFLIRRYQVVLGIPANGKLDWMFCHAVACFQRDRGLKMNGKLAGDTVTRMTWALKKFHGMDKKGLLTRREVKMAQKRTLKRIKSGSLTWKAVAELRKLLKLSPQGGINAEFLRKVAEFQLHHGHGLGRSGYLSKNTAKQMRDELGTDYSKKIANAAEASYGMKSGTGHSPAATQNGKLACAWAVNEVFKKAVGRKFGDLSVDSVQSALEAAGNHQVKPNEAKPGDVNLIPGSHIGIVTPSGSRSLSNSSSQAKFVYRSALNFPEAYGGTPVVYRVKRLK